jgi:hypothetical protein
MFSTKLLFRNWAWDPYHCLYELLCVSNFLGIYYRENACPPEVAYVMIALASEPLLYHFRFWKSESLFCHLL